MQEEPSAEQLLLDVQRLSAEVENLKRQKADLEILLDSQQRCAECGNSPALPPLQPALCGKSQRLALQPWKIGNLLPDRSEAKFYRESARPQPAQNHSIQRRPPCQENESVNPSKFKIPKLKLVCLDLYDRTRENHVSHQSISPSRFKIFNFRSRRRRTGRKCAIGQCFRTGVKDSKLSKNKFVPLLFGSGKFRCAAECQQAKFIHLK